MKFALFSDLHLGHHSGKSGVYWGRLAIELGLEAVVVVGDLENGSKRVIKGLQLLREEADKYPELQSLPIIYVPGNHDFYGDVLEDAIEALSQPIADGVIVLQDQAMAIGDTQVFGCTLWSGMNLYDEVSNTNSRLFLDKHWSDYEWIKTRQGRLTTEHTMKLHATSCDNIRAWARVHEGEKRLVLTHFLPSEKSAPERYAGNLENNAFSSRCEDLVMMVDCWCHGHTHDKADYQIGESRVVCNPRGYPGEWYPRNGTVATNIIEV